MSRKKDDEDGPLIEPAKPFLFARGLHTSQRTKDFMADVSKLKKSVSKTLSGKHDFHPMEDETGIEMLCTRKSNAGLFAFGTENKKRPHNCILGRMFDSHVLDMIELGITEFESMADCQKRTGTPSASSFQAPLLLFQGEGFANAPEGSTLNVLQSLFLDMFSSGNRAKEMDLEQIDLALVFTCASATDSVVTLQGFRIAFGSKLKDSNAPKISLLEHGPNCTFALRRTRIAAPDLAKNARRQPKLPGQGNTKNVSSDPLRGLVGQIHMKKQDTNKLVMRSRFKKALKRPTNEEQEIKKKMKTQKF